MSTLNTYPIQAPAIKSGSVYLFTTEADVDYEVRFARKKEDLLYTTIAFGVLNEEYEGEEYVLTNKADVFKVMRTIVAVVDMYMQEHLNVRTYAFTGEPTPQDARAGHSKRLRLYQRYIPLVFPPSIWKVKLEENKMVISREHN